jgi:hypothetical protein
VGTDIIQLALQIESQIANAGYAFIFQLFTIVARGMDMLFRSRRYENL